MLDPIDIIDEDEANKENSGNRKRGRKFIQP